MVKRMASLSAHVYLILNIFICKGVTVVADIDCHFDMNFCDWQQDALDDFNWKMGKSGYLDTGPSYDHTTGEDYYIYVDPHNNDKGEISRLISPMVSPGEYCLTFWYRMYGSDIGTLNVYKEMNDGNKTVTFSKDKGMDQYGWWKSVLNIKSYGSYQIVFEGIIGDSDFGLIAIDDIYMRSGSCSIDCDFDVIVCNWMQFDGDDFNWVRGNGRASYSFTGPDADKSGNGYYVYVDSYNNGKGEKARLMSPMLSSGQYCLTFWYSMYGSNISALNVYIEMKDGNKTVIFSKNKDIGVPDWWKSVSNINAFDSYQIVFEGIIGDGYSGDIAIDDISIRSGSCSIDCDFNDDFCNWMQYDGDNFDWDRGKGKTATSNTGPNGDHTSGDGHYIYIETSYKNKKDTAILLSPLQDAGKYCFSFWYYMYGDGIDRLRLQIWNMNGSDRHNIFTLKSAQGQHWFQKMIFLHSVDVFQITFEGRVKDARSRNRNKGDIAIDDVKMVSCQDCTDLEIGNAVTNSSQYEYGSVVKLQCDNGYNLVGDSEIVCKTMGNWSGTASCIPYDCGNLTIPNGTLFTPNGTRYGHGGIQKCNTGFVLIGDPDIKCTVTGWSNTTAYCNVIVSDEETNSSPLIAMYVLIPVVFLMIAATFIVLYMRRRHLSCKKVLKTFSKAREVPSGDSRHKESHSNQMYSNEDLQPDDEYATISGEQTDDKNLRTVYYATADRSGIKKLGVSKEANQTKSTDYNKSVCSIDLNECNTYNVLSAKALNKTLKGGEEHDLDYDSACTRRMKTEASNHDDYSHMGDLEMEYQHTQHCLPQPDIEKNTDYSHIDSVSTSTKFPERLETDYNDYDEYQNPVIKEKKVLAKHTTKIKQLEDQAPDYYNVAQTKEMYENNEPENQSNESENHDYFILEKT